MLARDANIGLEKHVDVATDTRNIIIFPIQSTTPTSVVPVNKKILLTDTTEVGVADCMGKNDNISSACGCGCKGSGVNI